jgi:hypothetical protein
MELFGLPLLFLVYWIIDKVQEHQGNKRYQEYEAELRRMGLK